MCYLLLVSGRVHAQDPACAGTAVAMRDGRFLAVGGGGEVRGPARPVPRLIGLDGRRSLPGQADPRRHDPDRAPGRRGVPRREEKP